MANNDSLIFGIVMLIIYLCLFFIGIYKCGKLKDEINKDIYDKKR